MGHEWNEGGPATAAALPDALERVTAAHRAVGAEDLGEVVQERLTRAGVFPGPELIEQHGGVVPAGVHDLLAARFQQERTARLALEQELEEARRLVGQGPFVVVKADSLNAIADGGEIHFKLAFGNGVTRHMIPALLSLAWQSITETASGSQGDTVRLPQPAEEPQGHAQRPDPRDVPPGY